MRINGTYIERYFFTTFPWILISGVYCYFGITKNFLIILPTLLLMSIIFILIDSIPFRKHELLKVILLENELNINSQLIKENEISIIRPFKTTPPHSCLIIELYLNDNICLEFLDKPKSFLYKSNNKIGSKSLDLILEKMPSLKKKIRTQNNY